jgi:hypothetical protein
VGAAPDLRAAVTAVVPSDQILYGGADPVVVVRADPLPAVPADFAALVARSLGPDAVGIVRIEQCPPGQFT